jgi:hypothetical protein
MACASNNGSEASLRIDVRDGSNSFFRQLDFVMASVANPPPPPTPYQPIISLLLLPPNHSTSHAKKHYYTAGAGAKHNHSGIKQHGLKGLKNTPRSML